MPRRYVPGRGDVVRISLSPQAGHEQAGRRPALVISPASYNGRVGLAILCPITSRLKGYPFEVSLPAGLKVSGAVLSDQVKSLDWRARGGRKRLQRAAVQVVPERRDAVQGAKGAVMIVFRSSC